MQVNKTTLDISACIASMDLGAQGKALCDMLESKHAAVSYTRVLSQLVKVNGKTLVDQSGSSCRAQRNALLLGARLGMLESGAFKEKWKVSSKITTRLPTPATTLHATPLYLAGCRLPWFPTSGMGEREGPDDSTASSSSSWGSEGSSTQTRSLGAAG